jgi:hypothetical protein
MTAISISFYVLTGLMWSMVAWAIVTWRREPPEVDEDDDGGIPPVDEPSGPEIDWGRWAEMETREEMMV